jgi:hypothetical protein
LSSETTKKDLEGEKDRIFVNMGRGEGELVLFFAPKSQIF